ncbi:MAG: hypothetical protein J6Z36_00010 [Clostridia bacterium]|nr:hypothetical protein [Clostridia bacterium]
MKGKISAFEIALSAIAAAIGALFLSLGTLNNYLLATGYIVACFALMLPLSKGFILGDALAYVAIVLLSFLFGGLSVPWRMLPFIIFFGLHPLVNFLQLKFKWNQWIALVIKAVWFDVAAYLLWRFVFGMTNTFEWIDQYIIPVIIVGGTLFFVVYDHFIFRCQIAVDKIVSRIKK